MRRLLALIALAFAAAALLPASASAALPCISVAGVTTCPGTPVKPAPSQECQGQDAQPSALGALKARAAVLCLLNIERGKQGIDPLRASSSLRAAAQRYAKRMARDDFFAHVGPSGDTLRDRIRKTSYLSGASRWSLGENIAYGGGRYATPAEIVKSWMASPGHKRNILDAGYRDIGIGIVSGLPIPGGAAGSTYVTNFGSR